MNKPLKSPGATTPDQRDIKLTAIERIFLTTDGSITSFLEALTGESISVRKLDIEHHGQCLPVIKQNTDIEKYDYKRRVLLCGADSGTNYLFAEIMADTSKLGQEMLQMLASTSIPIGKIWQTLKTEQFRELQESGVKSAPLLGHYFATSSHALYFYRYSIYYTQNQPYISVYEWLPVEFLQQAG